MNFDIGGDDLMPFIQRLEYHYEGGARRVVKVTPSPTVAFVALDASAQRAILEAECGL